MSNLPVGSVVYSILDENTFQAQMGGVERWVLADGRSLAGQHTQYENLLHDDEIPNLLGVFIRGKNNGRADGNQNPDGEILLGSVTAHRFGRHGHTGSTGTDAPDHSHGFGGYNFNAHYGNDNAAQNLNTPVNGFSRQTDGASGRHTHAIPAEGGPDTAPTNVTLNPFIRVN